MKLDRNINAMGRGKYALLKLRNWPKAGSREAHAALAAAHTLKLLGILDLGDTPETEFFVMRLKDQFAQAGLIGYGLAACSVDPEYAKEIEDLAKRAGPSSAFCKMPD